MTATSIFIISLPQSETRRQLLSSRLRALGLDYEITDAVNGAELNLETITPSLPVVGREKLHGGRGLSRGEIGCFLSHYNLWRRIVDNNIEHAVILEDDAVLQNDFAAVVHALPAVGWRWDVVRFSAYGIDRYLARGKRGMIAEVWNQYRVKRMINRVLCPIGQGRHLVRYKQPVLDAAAYMLTRRAAEVLLRYCVVIQDPVDIMLEKWYENNLHFFAIHLPVAGQISREFPAVMDSSILEHDRAELGEKIRKSRRSIRNKVQRSLNKNRNRWRCFVWNLQHPPEKLKPD